MIYIQKGEEPHELIEYKKQEYAYFDGAPKASIRKKLLEEQGCLCAYCMRRINEESMKIEHWYPENQLDDVGSLDYKNMLGVCEGHIAGQDGKNDTCDAQKKSEIITVNPLIKETLKTIKYKSKSGEIYSDDPDIQRDLDVTLNLNSKGHRLSQNRKEKLDAVIFEFKRKIPKGQWPKTKMKKFIYDYSMKDDEGQKKEYVGIVEWYFNRKIRNT